jgi:hypothetical protein
MGNSVDCIEVESIVDLVIIPELFQIYVNKKNSLFRKWPASRLNFY